MEKLHKESKVSIFGTTLKSSSSSCTSSSNNSYFDDDSHDVSLEVLEHAYGVEDDAIEWVLKNEAYCFDVTRFAEKLITATYVEGKKRMVRRKKVITTSDVVEPLIHDIVTSVILSKSDSDFSSVPHFKPSSSSNELSEQSSDWPKISEFNIKLGLEKLEDYVSSWERSNDWLFCVEFLGFESEDCSNIFVYEVEWSKPTNAYPIPQATASVYFALEVLKMVPCSNDRNIEVTYVFECSNVIHSPGKINFQERWLEAIINAKLQIFKSLTFSVSNCLLFFY